MLPVKDDLEIERLPIVSLTIMITCALVWFVTWGMGDTAWQFYAKYALVPASFWAGEQPWAIVTSQFLHGGWIHVITNLIFMWIVADDVEESLGHVKFLVLYLGAGAFACFCQLFAGTDSTVPMVGASGSIAGVMGAFWVLHPKARIETIFPNLWLVAAVVLLDGLVVGLVALGFADNTVLFWSGALTLLLLVLSIVMTLVTADWILASIPVWVWATLLGAGAVGAATAVYFDFLNPFHAMRWIVGIAIAGLFLLVGSWVLRRSRPFLSTRTYLRAPLFIGGWFAYNVIAVLSLNGGEIRAGGVAYWAHIGGLLAGVALALVLAPGKLKSRVIRYSLAGVLTALFVAAVAVTYLQFPV